MTTYYDEDYAVRFVRVRGDACEVCAAETSDVFRIYDDPNGAYCCEGCASEYALRAHYQDFYAIPAEAWGEDIDYLRELANAEWPGGLAAFVAQHVAK